MEACFAHNHMTCRQYGLWSRIRELQHKFGLVYFDADFLSAGFQSTSRDTIYDDCNVLLKAGWFELLAPRKRKKDGTWEARKLRSLSHKEWAAKYPDKCMSAHVSQSPQSNWNQSPQSNQPVAPQQMTSRSTANNQSLPDDKDLVLKQTSFKADIVQSRRGNEANAISEGFKNGILDDPPQESMPAESVSTPVSRDVSTDVARPPLRLSGRAPNGRPWSEWPA